MGELRESLPDHSNERTLLGVHMLRGAAAFAVLLHHTLEETQGLWLSGPRNHAVVLLGASGVDIFFVISGFIMFHSTWHRFGQIGAQADFAVRRIIRIIPLYWICTVMVVALAATGVFYKSKTITAEATFKSLAFLPTDDLIHGVGWTLQYEMYFYLLFTAALASATRRTAIIALPSVLLLVITLAQFLPSGPTQRFLANPISIEFAYGILIAWLFRRGMTDMLPPYWFMFAGIVGLIAAAYLMPSLGTAGLTPSVRFIGWGIPAALIVLASIAVDHAKGIVRRGFSLLGDVSYSLYLTHAFVMTAYARLIKTTAFGEELGPLNSIICAVIVSVFVATITYVYVERPMTDWLRSKWKTHQRRGMATARVI